MNIKNLFSKVTASTLVLALFATLSIPMIAGCNGQNTAAIVVSSLGTTLASIETIEGNAALGNQLNTDFAAVAGAIQNWVPGTSVQDIIQALNIVTKDINLIPVANNSTDQQLIILAISEVDQILSLYTNSTVVSLPGAVSSERVVFTVKESDVKKIQKDFKTKANEIISHDPSRASLRVK